LQKALLELITEYPNDTPNWKTIPESISLDDFQSLNVNAGFQLVKIGDVD